MSLGQPTNGAAVPRYVAKFIKNVLSDTGHQASITQRSFDLDAHDREEATRLAKIRFCETEGITDWSSHADDLLIQEADFPS
jgi:hypothetical protein